MKTFIVGLKSGSPYSQSRHYDAPKKERELHKDYEARTWRERLHVNKEDYVQIPPMAFKNCLAEAAKFMSVQIPGKGKSTYTKHFEAGLLVLDPLVLPVKKNDVDGEWFFVPSDGMRGGGKRVEKCFPVIPNWEGVVKIFVLDDIIQQDVLVEHLKSAGLFIGIGRFRPRNNGFYGRFEITSIKEI